MKINNKLLNDVKIILIAYVVDLILSIIVTLVFGLTILFLRKLSFHIEFDSGELQKIDVFINLFVTFVVLVYLSFKSHYKIVVLFFFITMTLILGKVGENIFGLKTLDIEFYYFYVLGIIAYLIIHFLVKVRT